MKRAKNTILRNLNIFIIAVILGDSAFFINECGAKMHNITQGNDDDRPLVLGRQIETYPSDDYAIIKTEPSLTALQQLISAKDNISKTASHKIVTHSGNYNPPVLCALSGVLLKRNRPNDAAFWYYACILRAMSDVNKTPDNSAKTVVAELQDRYQTIINTMNDQQILDIARQVVAWDQKTPKNYDPCWLVLHSVGAFSGATFSFAPRSKWQKIDAKTRQEFLARYTEPDPTENIKRSNVVSKL